MLVACEHAAEDSAARPSSHRSNAQEGPAESAIQAAIEAVEKYEIAGDLESAEAIAARLCERAPSDWRAAELYGRVLVMRGLAAAEAGDAAATGFYHRAYEQYRSAVALEPTPELHQSAGSVAVMGGENQAALGHYLAAAAIDPLNPQHPLFAAQLMLQERRFQEADDLLARALELNPELATAQASRAVVAMEDGRFDEARSLVAAARQLDPANLDLRLVEARILRRSGDPNAALRLLLPLNERDRAAAPVATEIALSFNALGNHRKEAEAWMHRCGLRANDPQIWRAQIQAGRALLRAGERERANLWLQEAQLKAPDAPEVAALRAEIAASDE